MLCEMHVPLCEAEQSAVCYTRCARGGVMLRAMIEILMSSGGTGS